MLLAQLPLHAGWLGDPAGVTLANPFHGVHAWAGSVVGESLWAGRWPDPTDAAGFPVLNRARYIGWAFLGVAAALHGWVSPLVVVNGAAILGPALGATALVAFARRLQPGAHPAALWAAGVLYGLAPVTLGAAASGQVENAQSWVLPLLLLLLWEGCVRRPPWAGVLALGWALGALTSPYLGLMAGLAAPWVWWGRRSRRGLLALGAAAAGLLGARAYLRPGAFDPDRDLFRPNFGYAGPPDLFSTPIAVADLDTLLLGAPELQVRTLVMHQPYLGLALLAGALALGRGRRRHGALALLGVTLAVGPVLAWQEQPLLLAGRAIALPASLLQAVDFPLARGGQYYRAAILGSLGLSLMIAQASAAGWRRAALLAVALVGSADALRSVAAAGLPWPVTDLPEEAWVEWRADPVPGAVVHLPMFSEHLQPNHPARLAGRTVHGRALVAMPRSFTQPPSVPLLQGLRLCTRPGEACALPALSSLQAEGFRYVALDLPDTPERVSLRRRLVASWGEPSGAAGGLEWWTVGGAP